MTLEEFTEKWQAMRFPHRSHDDIRRMIYAKREWRLRKLTTMEFLRPIFDAVFIFVMIVLFNMFSHWITTIGAFWCIGMWLERYLGLRYLLFVSFFSQKNTPMQQLLQRALAWIKAITQIINVTYVLLWIAASLVMTLQKSSGQGINFWWALILSPALAGAIWWSNRKWREKREEIEGMLRIY
jgi:hypothetical protein